MDTVIGLLLFVVYIAVIIGAAASVTMIVVRFSPAKKPESEQQT